MEVISDSEITVKGIQRGVPEGSNSDLYQILFDMADDKEITLKARWVKSHARENPEFITQYGLKAIDVCGNTAADVMADKGAEMHQVADGYAESVLWYHRLVAKVQTRLCAVVKHLTDTFGKRKMWSQRMLKQMKLGS